jgi:hypothetical protein
VISLAVIAVVVVGTMVGVEFCVAFFVNPIQTALPVEASIAARSHGARLLGRAMPFWYFASLILVGGWAWLTWGQAPAAPALVSAILLAVSVIMSVTLLVPIASRSAKWTPETAPDDWRDQSRRWDALHYLRVAIILAAFVLAAVALALDHV